MLGLIIILFTLLIIAVALVGTAFWIWMIVDAAQNRYLDSNTRLVWILVIVFTHFIGALIYYIAGRKPSNAAVNTYPGAGYAQGQGQYYPNQQNFQAGTTQYAPPSPQTPQQGQYYEAPRASYPQQQQPYRPQD